MSKGEITRRPGGTGEKTQHLTALSLEQQLLVAAGLGDAAKVRKRSVVVRLSGGNVMNW